VFSLIGKTDLAYFKMINDKGGINGRKLSLITSTIVTNRQDGGANPQAGRGRRRRVHVRQRRHAPNTAVQRYLNDKKIPQLFIVSGADKWADPAQFPWTIGWQPSFRTEAKIYARTC